MDTAAGSPPYSKQRLNALLRFLGLACGVGVSSIYLSQPLLGMMAHGFHTSEGHAGYIAVATQLGYAAGILLFVPLGDVQEKRSLITRMFLLVAVAMGVSALAPTLSLLVAASIMVGLFASLTHIVLPIAPDVAPAESRGRAIGFVMTGLLLGILLARAFGGGLAMLVGWRWVMGIMAIVNMGFAIAAHRMLPLTPPTQKLSYLDAMRSLKDLWLDHPVLRQASLQSGLLFASFSGFWTTLTFLLESPHYRMGSGWAGAFGLIGAVGASAAPLAGKMADRRGSRYVISIALGIMVLCWLVLWTGQYTLAGLVVGCILLDAGAQMNQIANQTRVFGLVDGARSRLNTVYMTVYFIGSSLGSYCASLAWSHWQWRGVVGEGLVFIGLSALIHGIGGRMRRLHRTGDSGGPNMASA